MKLLTVFFAIIAVTSITLTIVKEYKNRNFILVIWKRFRFLMLLEVIGVILLVLTAFILLTSFIPFLQYGWTDLLWEGGGNVSIAPVVEVSTSSSNWFMQNLPFLFLILLIVALPFLAKMEEKWFRYGYEEWGGIIVQSIKFGLIHLVAGIPIAAGIALIISGLFFGSKYKKAFNRNIKVMSSYEARDEALLVSTTYHTMYNTFLIIVLLSTLL